MGFLFLSPSSLRDSNGYRILSYVLSHGRSQSLLLHAQHNVLRLNDQAAEPINIFRVLGVDFSA